MRRDDAAHPDLLAERVLHRVRKRPPGARERPQRAGEDPIELQHAALVEDHRVEVVRLEPGVIQAPFDGRRAESRRRSCAATAAPPARRRPARRRPRAPRPRRGSARRCRGSSCQYSAGRRLVARRAGWASTRAARAVPPAWPATRRAAAGRNTGSSGWRCRSGSASADGYAADTASTAGSRAPATRCRRYDSRRDTRQLLVRVVHVEHFVAQDLFEHGARRRIVVHEPRDRSAKRPAAAFSATCRKASSARRPRSSTAGRPARVRRAAACRSNEPVQMRGPVQRSRRARWNRSP